MSDTKKPEKKKRGYRAGGVTLAHDVRVRIDEKTHDALTKYAKRHKTTRAAAARAILKAALNPENE